MPCSDNVFVSEVLDFSVSVKILSFVLKIENSFSDCKLIDSELLAVNKMNFFIEHNSIKNKLMNYISAIFKGASKQGDSSFFYIYFPGYVPIIVSLYCLIFNRPFGLYVRGGWDRSKWYKRVYWKLLFSKASFILTTGGAFSRLLMPFNNMVDEVVPMMKFSKNDLEPKYNYEKNTTLNLLFVGRIEKTKGVFVLVEAIQKIIKENSADVCLMIVGGGDHEDKRALESVINDNNLSLQIKLMGQIKEPEILKKYFKEADIFVFPSYYNEGFPRVLYEAMSFGLPIITTPLDGIVDMLKDNNNCLYAEKEQSDSLCQQIMKLNEDELLRKRLGIAAFKDIETMMNKNENMSHAKQVVSFIQNHEKI